MKRFINMLLGYFGLEYDTNGKASSAIMNLAYDKGIKWRTKWFTEKWPSLLLSLSTDIDTVTLRVAVPFIVEFYIHFRYEPGRLVNWLLGKAMMREYGFVWSNDHLSIHWHQDPIGSSPYTWFFSNERMLKGVKYKPEQVHLEAIKVELTIPGDDEYVGKTTILNVYPFEYTTRYSRWPSHTHTEFGIGTDNPPIYYRVFRGEVITDKLTNLQVGKRSSPEEAAKAFLDYLNVQRSIGRQAREELNKK